MKKSLMKKSLFKHRRCGWSNAIVLVAALALAGGCSIAPRVGNIDEVAFAELKGEYRKVDLVEFESRVNERLRGHPFDMKGKSRLTIKIDGSDASVTHTSYSNVFTQKPSVIAAEIVERLIRNSVIEHNSEACGRHALITGGAQGEGDFWIVLDYLYFEQDLRATRKTSAIIYSGSSSDFDGEVGNFFSESEIKVGATLTDCKTGRRYTETREVIHAEATLDKSIYLFSKDRGVVWVDTEKHSPGVNSAAEMAARAAIGGVLMTYLDESSREPAVSPRPRQCIDLATAELSDIQRYLQGAGYLRSGSAGADGEMGPETRSALDRYVQGELGDGGFECMTEALRKHFRAAMAPAVAIPQATVPGDPEKSSVPRPAGKSLPGLSVRVDNPNVRLGSTIELLFEADRPGSLSLWNRGSDGTVTRIYPSGARTLAVKAGDNWLVTLAASGTPGKESLYVVWTRAMAVHAFSETHQTPEAFFDSLGKDTAHSISDVLLELNLEILKA